MASNFFNKASLVMVPDAPIDGKLPSVKPEDRSGDFIFSRGSNLAATRVNKDSLIEKGRENLLLQSNQFDTTWTKSNATLTSGQSGYDGSLDAWLLSKTGTGTLKQELTQSGVQSFSIYAKAGTSNWIRLLINGVALAYYDLSNGVVGTTSYSTFIDANIESVGGGWYRCSLVGSGSTSLVNIVVANADNDVSNTSGSIYIQDAQLEQGLVATEYIDTTTATVQKGILENLPRLDYSGSASCPSLLLEPSRTNYLPLSEYLEGWVTIGSPTITTNYGISPEGIQNSTRFVAVSGDRKYTAYNLAYAEYTYSIYVKGTGSLSLTDNTGAQRYDITPTSEWQRYDYTFTGAISNVQIRTFSACDVEIYGIQLEAGSYPTSYIPTYGTSVTRGVDYLPSSAIDVSGLVNDNNFTLYIETGDFIGSDSNGNNLFVLYNSLGGNLQFRVRTVDFRYRVNSVNGGEAYIAAGSTSSKHLIKYNGSEYEVFYEGASQGTFASTADGVLSEIRQGTDGFSSNIKQILLFPEALSDADCITLTT